MPRKRRSPKARVMASREVPAPVIDFLLGGFAGLRDDAEDYDGFIVFEMSDDEMAAMWEANRDRLMAEAARRGIGQPYGAIYDGKVAPETNA